MNPQIEHAILEFYKAHYNATETSKKLGVEYQKISAIFRGFKAAKISKYDRFILIPDDIRADLNIL